MGVRLSNRITVEADHSVRVTLKLPVSQPLSPRTSVSAPAIEVDLTRRERFDLAVHSFQRTVERTSASLTGVMHSTFSEARRLMSKSAKGAKKLGKGAKKLGKRFHAKAKKVGQKLHVNEV